MNLGHLLLIVKPHVWPALLYVGVPLAITEAAGWCAGRWLNHRAHVMVFKSFVFLTVLIIPSAIAAFLTPADHSHVPLTFGAVSKFMEAYLPKAFVLGLVYGAIETIRLWPSSIFSGVLGWILQIIVFYILINVWPLGR